MDRIVERGAIYDAWSDEPWVVDGAAVRVSLICFASKRDGLPTQLNGENAPRINADLTSASVDLTHAVRLPQNAGVAFMGDTKGGPFDLPGDQAREWLKLPCQPERSDQRRRAQALGQRHGPDPPSAREMDRRLWLDDV